MAAGPTVATMHAASYQGGYQKKKGIESTVEVIPVMSPVTT